MSKHIRIEGSETLVRERYSGGIINTSSSEYQTYMSVQKGKQAQKAQIQNMCSEINTLKNEMSDIKSMLIKILREVIWQS